MQLCRTWSERVQFVRGCLEFGVQLGGSQVECGLEVQPGPSVAAEVETQAQRGVCCDAAPSDQDVVDAGCRYPQMPGKHGAAHVVGLQKVLAQDLAGVDWAHAAFSHVVALLGGVGSRKLAFEIVSWK